MDVKSFSGTIVSGTELKLRIPAMPQGAQILLFELSVENTTIVQVKGISNLNFLRVDNGKLLDGILLGGDIQLKLRDLNLLSKNILKVNGSVHFIFNQSTGSDVNFAGLIGYQEL